MISKSIFILKIKKKINLEDNNYEEEENKEMKNLIQFFF
jgi:hypothetical protein